MRINKHIGFDEDAKELIQYLRKHNIVFDDKTSYIFSLDIFEDDPHWEHIQKYMRKYDLDAISETVFSKEELQNAAWMSVRSCWHYRYPQPEDGYQSIVYSSEDACPECGKYPKQIDAFRIIKPPKWGQRHFFMLNWVFDEFFVDEHAKNLLEREFSFLSFRAVKNKTGTETFPNVFQLIIPTLPREGIVEKQPYLRGVLMCPRCKSPKYHPRGGAMLKLRREIFENAPDMVKTAEWFGWGCGADRQIAISQKMYRFLVTNHLDRGLVFEPYDLID